MSDYEEIEVTDDSLADESVEVEVIALEEVVVESETPLKAYKKKAVKTHVVQDGENIQTIAALYCGDRNRQEYAKELFRKNKGIAAGKVVIL